MSLLSSRINELRTSRNLLQQTVSEDLGISLKSFQRYERGEREPTSSTLLALADYFNVPLDYLVGRDVSPGCPLPTVTPDELALVEKFRALPTEKRKAIEALLD